MCCIYTGHTQYTQNELSSLETEAKEIVAEQEGIAVSQNLFVVTNLTFMNTTVYCIVFITGVYNVGLSDAALAVAM